MASSSGQPCRLREPAPWYGDLKMKGAEVIVVRDILTSQFERPVSLLSKVDMVGPVFLRKLARAIFNKHPKVTKADLQQQTIPPGMEKYELVALYYECKLKFSTEEGLQPESLEEIIERKCLPHFCRTLLFLFDPMFFIHAVSPMIAEYVMFKELIYSDVSNPGISLFCDRVKNTGPHGSIKKLITYINNNIRVYQLAMQFLDVLFRITSNNTYCTMKVETKMLLHEINPAMLDGEKSTGFLLWIQDCIKKGRIEPNCKPSHVPILEVPLPNGIDDEQYNFDLLIEDIIMIIQEPKCLDLLSDSLVSYFISNMDECGVIRHTHFQILLKILNIGLNGQKYRNAEVPLVPVLQIQKIRDFLVPFSFMAHEAIKRVNNQSNVTRVGKRRIMQNWNVTRMQKLCSENMINSLMAMSFTMAVVQKADRISICRMMLVLPYTMNGAAYSDWYLNQLVVELLRVRDIFLDTTIVDHVFDNFLIEGLSRHENIPRHILKLMLFLRDFVHMHKYLKRYLLLLRKGVLITESILEKFKAHFDYEEGSSTEEFDPEYFKTLPRAGPSNAVLNNGMPDKTKETAKFKGSGVDGGHTSGIFKLTVPTKDDDDGDEGDVEDDSLTE